MSERLRDRLIIFLLCLPLLLYMGYCVHRYATRYETVVVTEDRAALEGISLALSSSQFSTKDFLLTYTLTNLSDESIGASALRVEHQNANGTWEYEADTRAELVTRNYVRTASSPDIFLDPGETCIPTEISLRQYWPSLRSGTYRLALDYHTSQPNYDVYTAYAQFSVTEKGGLP